MTRCDEVGAASTFKAPIKILVVEDEVLVRLAVGQFLREQGYVVTEAMDTAEAMRAVRADPAIAVVFTDIIMPGSQDGQVLADWLGLYHPAIKVVIASGVRPAPGSHVPFLQKPYAFTDLVTLIERLVRP